MPAARHAFIDLAPLRTDGGFPRFWASGVLAGLGGQVAVVALLFQVWESTRNPFWVGAIGLAQAVPQILLGLLGGPLADALDRRRVALWSGAGQALAALALGLQLVLGAYPLLALLGLVSLQTACAAVGAPARRTFTARLLPRELVPAGIALHMISFQAAMLAGPALGGLLLGATSPGACYLVNAVALLLTWWAVLTLPELPPRPDERAVAVVPGSRSGWGTRVRHALGMVAEGLVLVGRDPVLRGSFLLDLAATVLSFPMALFPMVNDSLFAGDPRTLGFFLSAVAVGGIGAGLASGLTTRARHLGRIQVGAVAAWGLAVLVFGLATLAQLPWLALVGLVVGGAADTVSVTSRAAMVQLATADSHLGRVSAVEHVIGVAGPDLGNARAGALAGWTSPAWSAVLGALTCLVVAAGVGLTHRPLAAFAVAEPGPAADGQPPV